ncbi:glycosyltransferase [Weissella paramesenteroides]|jgi:glycosyltransferase involved in cell wall biosynthesis|uniref:glycosyltransferase n=1 Tax=Weissella paramesenteroides TaxID=1249 RepID=UPI0013DBE8A2|nr:glycosyltransferase [Weissella paramesenteroides]NEZ88705.1 glycosyltransferase [Weissella paramesenteroides]NFB03031.1 glycosyltransferase [Weissella paramesenteroides]
MKYFIFMQGNLHSTPAGLQRSALQRATAFKKRGINSSILTNNYNPDHESEMHKLRNKGLLNNKVFSMYQDFEDNSIGRNGSFVNDEFLSSYDVINDLNNPNWQRVYKNGEYCYFIVRNAKNGKILQVKELFKSQVVTKETHYSSAGIPKFEYLFDFRNGKKIRKNYLNKNGGVFCSESLDSNEKVLEIQLFIEKGNESFKNIDDLTLYWLENFVSINDKEDIILISEYAEFKDALIRFKTNRAKQGLITKLMIALHNNHSENGEIKPYFKSIFSRISEYDAVVCLTEEQKQDLQSQLSDNVNNIFVVPHSIVHHDFKEIIREKNRIAVGGRFAPVKNIEDSIRAIQEVVKVLPEVKFYIFGRGNLRATYEKLITDLGLQKNVILSGFTDNMNKEYAKSDLCLMTSKNEGFPLSLIEAMDAGAVPVVYPYKYGPKDMINSDESGVITEHNDYHEIAQSVIDLLINRFKLERIRKNTMEISNIFSEDNMVNKWLDIVKKVY